MATSGSCRDKDSISCPLCYEEYDEPMLLTCSHIICNRCVKHLQRRGKLKCPDCKHVMDVSEVTVEPALQQALDTLSSVEQSAGGFFSEAKDLLCSECAEGMHRWYCPQCDLYLCADCSAAHEQNMEKLGQSHTLQSTKESSRETMEGLLALATECETMIEQCTRKKEHLASHARDIEREKVATLEFLRQIQQQMVDMVNSFFTSIDEAYMDATPEEMDLINDRLAAIRSDPSDPMFSLKEMRIMTDELLKEDGISIESFHKIKQMHVEELEKFRSFYGSAFKLPERVGDETRRYSNLHRSKAVLEALTGYDPDGSKAQERGLTEALPTLDELVQITGMSKSDVQTVLELYNVRLFGSDPFQRQGEEEEPEVSEEEKEDSRLEGATALCSGQENTNSTGLCHASEICEETVTTNSKGCDNKNNGSQQSGDLAPCREPPALSPAGSHAQQSQTLCTSASHSNDALFCDTEEISQGRNRQLVNSLEHLNLGEVPDT